MLLKSFGYTVIEIKTYKSGTNLVKSKTPRATCDDCGWFGYSTDLVKGNCPKCGSNAINTES